MLGPRQAKEFIEKNRDSLVLLGEILKDADSVQSQRYARYSFESRALAIEMVEEWVKQVFGIAFTHERFQETELNIIRRLDTDFKESD